MNLSVMDHITSMHIPVCRVKASNGFEIEQLRDLLCDEDFDNHSPHVHSFYEILWFRRGTGRHTVDFANYEVRENTILFLVPGQIHHFDHEVYEGVSIKTSTDFMQGVVCPCVHVDEATARVLDQLVRQMEEEAQRTGEFGNRDMLQSLLRMFLIETYRHGVRDGQLTLDPLRPAHELFVRFRTLVEEQYHQMHSVQQYARELGTSVRTLNKCVNDCSGLSPLAFINARIMLEAKRLVRYSDLRIKEVAFRLGYDDPSYFVRLFKRHTGYMPTEFREAE